MLRRLVDRFEAFARTRRGEAAGRDALLFTVLTSFLASAASASANGSDPASSAMTGLFLIGGTDGRPMAGLTSAEATPRRGGAAYGASVAFERHAIGGGVVGGDGDGLVVDGVWMHARFDAEIATLARDVVAGKRPRLPGVLLRARRAERIGVRRQQRERYREENARRGIPSGFDILDPVVPFPLDDV